MLTTPPRVVVGIHHSPTGLAALRQAVEEARRRRATLLAVRAWSANTGLGDTTWFDGGATDVAVGEIMVARQEAALDTIDAAFAAGLGGRPSDVDCRPLSLPGSAGRVLVRVASRTTDLLIVGARGRRNRYDLWRTSTTRYCLRAAGCPVLVVPAPPLAGVSPREIHRQVRRLVRTTAQPGTR